MAVDHGRDYDDERERIERERVRHEDRGSLSFVLKEVASGFEGIGASVKELKGGTETNSTRLGNLEHDIQRMQADLKPIIRFFETNNVGSRMDLTEHRIEVMEKKMDGWWKWIGGVVASLLIMAAKMVVEFLQKVSER